VVTIWSHTSRNSPTAVDSGRTRQSSKRPIRGHSEGRRHWLTSAERLARRSSSHVVGVEVGDDLRDAQPSRAQPFAAGGNEFGRPFHLGGKGVDVECIVVERRTMSSSSRIAAA
jgi:hypothetical protein